MRAVMRAVVRVVVRNVMRAVVRAVTRSVMRAVVRTPQCGKPIGAPAQQPRPALPVAARRVREADRELREPLPQVAFRLGARLPGVLEDLVGVEGHPGVEEPLRLAQGLGGGAHDALGLPGHSLGPVGQGAAEPVTGACAPRPALLVAIPRRPVHPSIVAPGTIRGGRLVGPTFPGTVWVARARRVASCP